VRLLPGRTLYLFRRRWCPEMKWLPKPLARVLLMARLITTCRYNHPQGLSSGCICINHPGPQQYHPCLGPCEGRAEHAQRTQLALRAGKAASWALQALVLILCRSPCRDSPRKGHALDLQEPTSASLRTLAHKADGLDPKGLSIPRGHGRCAPR